MSMKELTSCVLLVVRFYQMKGFPKEISISYTASFTFVTSSKSDLLSSICKCRLKKEFVFELG